MNVPALVTVVVAATALIVILAVTFALERLRRRTGGVRGVPWAIGAALLAWLGATGALAVAGAYRPGPGPAIPALPVVLLLVLGGAWFATTAVPSLRALLGHRASQPSLIALQSWRVLGVNFLILYALGKLPALFALPAGLGDIAAGLAAPFVARRLDKPGGRASAIAWNVFGLVDLVVAVGLGATSSPGPIRLFHTSPPAVVMTQFPMALVPTFLVPLSVLLHILSLRFLIGARVASARPAVTLPGRLEPGR